LTRSGSESEIVRVGVSLVAPFRESGQLRSHDTPTAIGVETDQPRGVYDSPKGCRNVQSEYSVVKVLRLKATGEV
ncbi:MAG TPA: hypothetical protein QF905_05545, partial [Acidimicrobiales bacterium]|nr:hypothetical protein [Acidimicrobiales bacterium]